MAAQQSWSAWLLDAYASVVSPNPAEPSHSLDNTHSTSSFDPKSAASIQSTTSASSSSPYGPYVRTGRGGAGNFTWQSQQPAQKTNENLEAQKPSTLSERRRAAASIEHFDTGEAIKTQAAQRPIPQYIRVGRGIVQSNEIQQSSVSPTPHAQSPVSPMLSSPPVGHPGRGGAGNHAAAAEMNDRTKSEKQERERTEAERRREKIEQEIQNILPAPPDAWLGGRRRSIDPADGQV